MLNQYLKQCCLVLNPADASPALVSAMHTVTAGLELHKMVFTHSEKIADYWRKLDYTVSSIPAATHHAIWQQAFSAAFDAGYRKVILLHAAPAGFMQKHLEEAFLSLRILEVCMGPLKDGGLYLTGLNQFRPELLENNLRETLPLWKTLQRSAGSVKAAMYKTPLL